MLFWVLKLEDDQAFVYSESIAAVGGMPLGVQPKLIGLFSGGIDSVIGLWLVMKRGCPVIPVYFDNSPFTDETTTERALHVAESCLVGRLGFRKSLHSSTWRKPEANNGNQQEIFVFAV